MATQHRLLVRVALVVCAACGGKLASTSSTPTPADADDAQPSGTGTGSRAAPDADARATDGAIADAGVDVAAPPEIPDGCPPVIHTCLGAASCADNDPPMPLACAGAMSCADFCAARTGCSFAECHEDGGMFTCYTCNP